MRLSKICFLFLASISNLVFSSSKPGLVQMVTDKTESVNQSKKSTVSDPFAAMKTTGGEKSSVVSPEDKLSKNTDVKVSEPETKVENVQNHQVENKPEDKKTDSTISKENPKVESKPLKTDKEKKKSQVQNKEDHKKPAETKQEDLKKQEMEEHEAQLKQEKQIQEHTQKPVQEEHSMPAPQAVEHEEHIPVVQHEASEQDQEQDSEEDEMVESGLDTIDATDEGNWVLKRVWWEQAEAAFEKIIQLNDKIMQLQMQLVTGRNNFDREFNNLFKQIGLEQTQIISLINYLLEVNVSEDDQEKSKEEHEILDQVESKKDDFEKIKEDLSKFNEQDNLISEALIQLMQLVNRCRDYETKSWDDFKEIGRVLSDEKAKTLFYEIEANYKNVESIYNYINSELNNYMNSNLNEMGTLVKNTVDMLNKLDDEDLNLKSLVDKHKEALEAKKRLAEIKEQEALNKKVKVQKSKGFFGKVVSWFGSLWKSIKGIFGIK